MDTQLQLGDMTLDVVLKNIRNVHLSVHPPAGRVRIAAPSGMDRRAIRAFAVSKLGWIRKQQARIRSQQRETARDYVERETHYVWGRRYLMQVVENGRVGVDLRHDAMILHVRPGADTARRHAIVQAWYRQRIKEAIPPLRAAWEPVLGVRPREVTVRRMKTLWGSCSPRRGTIRINLDLARKPPACLEYILVHELVHLLEPSHNERFIACMDRYLPEWRHRRAELNRMPLPHSDWGY